MLTYTLLAGLKAVDRGPLAEKPAATSSPDGVLDVLEWFGYAAVNVRRVVEQCRLGRQNVSVNIEKNGFPLLPLREK